MKKILLLLVLGWIFLSETFAQQFPISPNAYDANGKRTGHWTVLYDSSWHETKNQDSAFHYRLVRFEDNKPVGKVRDFFRNGTKQWDGYLLSVNPDVQDGEVNYYFENGAINYNYIAKNGYKNGFYKQYYFNGKLQIEGTIENDSAEGKWISYSEEGVKLTELEYKKNQVNGKLIVFFPSGKIQKRGYKILNKTNGWWDEYYESGQLKSHEFFKEGLYHGLAETYFENGQQESKGQYVNDFKSGAWIYYHSNGKIDRFGEYDSEGNRTGIWKSYYANGNPNTVVERKNEKLNGSYEDYYESGKLKIKSTCVNDTWHGLLEGYFENGQLQKRGKYDMDSLEGEWIAYYEDGHTQYTGTYSNNKKNGLFKYYRVDGSMETEENLKMKVLEGAVINYYPNGKMSEQKHFKVSKLDGLFETFYESGAKKCVGTYKEGARVGDWYWYFENGKIESREPYVNGIMQGLVERYYVTGAKKTEALARNDWEEGLRKLYYASGKLKGIGKMHKHERHGHWVFYDSLTGVKESEGEYVNGKSDGKWNFYLDKMPVAYFINGKQETFYNIKDSLKILLDKGLIEAAHKTIEWMDKVRKRDFKNAKYEQTMMLYWRGFLADVEKKYSLALKYDNEFLREIIKIKGDTSVEYRNGTNNKALLLSDMGRGEDAIQTLKDQAALYINNPVESSGDVVSFENVAFVYNQNKKYIEEISYLKDILAKRKEMRRTNSHFTMQLLTTLGQTYTEDLNDSENAKTTFNSIIKLGDSLSVTNDEYYGNALYKMGILYQSSYKYDLARQYFKRAVKVLRNHLIDVPAYCMRAFTALGNNYIYFNQQDSAIFILDEMQLLINKIEWQNTIWQGKILQARGEIYFNQYETNKAAEAWLMAKEMLERLNSNQSIEYAEILQSLSVALPDQDITRTPQAIEYLEQAIALVKKLKGNSTKYRIYNTALARLYNNSGNFSKTEEILKTNMTAINEAEGKTSKFAECEILYTKNEYDLGHYTNAIDHALIAFTIMEPIKKEDPELYIDALSWLSSIYDNLNDEVKAESYSRQALEAARELIGPESIIVINRLQDLAKVLRGKSFYSEAEKVYKEAEALVKKTLGENNIKYGYLISSQAGMHREKGDYKKALREYLRYKPIVLKVMGEESPTYITLLTNLAITYEGLENLHEAEKLHLQSLNLAYKIYNNKNSECAWKMKNLADFYSQKGDYPKAEKYLSDAVQIQREVYGENNTEYANFLKHLAAVKSNMEKFKEAESLLTTAITINKKNINDRFGSYVASVEELQKFYSSFGRYQEAVDVFNEILPLIATKLGVDTRYANNLSHKANAFLGLEKYDSARVFIIQALSILEDKLAPTHWSVLEAHTILGIIELKQKNVTEAEKHFRFCVEQRKLMSQENTSSYTSSLNNLGATLIQKGELTEAQEILNQSLATNLKLKDAEGVDYNYLQLAKLNNILNKLDVAEGYYRQAMENRKAAIFRNFYFLSDHEKALFWKANRTFVDYFQSFALQRMKSNPAIVNDLYNLQLSTKGILLSTSNKIKKRILSSGDFSMINHYYAWLNQRDQLAQLYSLPKEELKRKKTKLDSLEVLAKASEKELNITSEDLEKDKGKETTWREVQKTLATNEAAIEVVRIKHHTTRPTDSTLYAIMILTTEMKDGPQAVVLPNGKLLEGRALKFYKNAIATQLIDSLSYRNYWAVIEPFVRNKTRLYLSLDGAYNSINLNTLMAPDGKFLVDSKNISIVANTKDIIYLKRNAQIFTKSNASLFGFPKYFIGKERLKSRDKQRDVDFDKLSDQDNSGIAELPGTLTEMEKVNDILSSHQWQVTTFANEEATEEAIKEIRQPGLLHIATHGFFTDEKDNTNSSDPMLRAGLLFTGAANYFQDKINIGADNGVLTAYEASNLNLDNTELVILSACETGKGEVQNGEGVYGLQRAFQTAGAKSILMSLWKVDDTATQELMTLFYENWTSGKTKTDAFKAAQLSLKKKYSSPYYWGAFVMMGN